MSRYFTRTFFKFLFGFLVMIVLGFSVLAFAAKEQQLRQPQPVDNVALPQ